MTNEEFLTTCSALQEAAKQHGLYSELDKYFDEDEGKEKLRLYVHLGGMFLTYTDVQTCLHIGDNTQPVTPRSKGDLLALLQLLIPTN